MERNWITISTQKKWVTCTPYFDVRNIHFYVNKLKFHIVEFYKEHHPDPHMPNDFIGDRWEGMLEFEKLMEEKKYDSNNLW